MTTNFNESWTTYTLSGCPKLSDIVDYVESTPEKEAGKCTWAPRYSSDHDEHGKVTSVTVDVDIVVYMPEWAEYGAASPEAQAEWNRFYQALQLHEQGHVDLVREKLADAHAVLLPLSPSEVEPRFQALLSDLDAASKAYDHQTDHGRNAGTKIDLVDATDEDETEWVEIESEEESTAADETG